ncbi:PTS mannose/fructose/sorbose/N-acetylgalactosamine transporter subunit IIC [Pediococcus acidilactici]|uniref:PTS mannose/fructose/sorbose/N-acetylgalactosamine transporter subunit IIC n=1 Tax=Pediococcus acidilactici TaxID=1254 RepID=UPI003A8D9F86
MQNIEAWKIIIITLYAFISINESLMGNLGLVHPACAGMITGLIMGNMSFGLIVGGTLELMQLGISSFGGATIPDFFTGAIVGTVFGILSNKGVQFAIGVGVPVGLLMVQLDILARFTNTWLLHKIDKAIEELKLKKIELYTCLGMIPWGLSRAIPVALMLIFGQPVVRTILAYLPDWLMGGLKVAGGLLPVVGIGILLRYLPTKKFIPELIVGFVLAAYLKMPILGVTLIGLALAMYDFKKFSSSTVVKDETGIVTVSTEDDNLTINSAEEYDAERGFEGDE